MLIDRLVGFKQITEPKPTNCPKGHTEKEQITKIQEHLFDNFESKLSSCLIKLQLRDSAEQDDCNCVIDNTLTKKNSIENWKFLNLD